MLRGARCTRRSGPGRQFAQGLAQPVELRLQLLAPPPHLLAARLELLGQPVAAVGALQGVAQALRARQQVAEIAPDQLVELRGRDKARWTALLAA